MNFKKTVWIEYLFKIWWISKGTAGILIVILEVEFSSRCSYSIYTLLQLS